MSIRLVDTTRQYQDLKEPIDAAIRRVVEHGRFILGPEVAGLEAEIAAECGCVSGIGVASGTDALLLSLAALGVKPGDEVITTPFTFVSTAEVISLLGATPVFADIKAHSFNLDPASVESKITERTVGILPVDLYGQVADMEGLGAIAEKHHLWMVEDAAQALGASRGGRKAGSFGLLGCISFFPTKNLGGFGDGGMVVTNDAALADRVRRLRYHGSGGGYEYETIGYNSRLDELQAAILRVKLPHLAHYNAVRGRTADFYRSQVRSPHLTLPHDETNGGHVYHQFTLRSGCRGVLAAMLKTRDIESKVYYPIPLHLQKSYAHLAYKVGSLPVAEAAAEEVLSIPISQELTEDERTQIATALNEFDPGGKDDGHFSQVSSIIHTS
ncbi:MAG: DegT/DnrJ/EryC1/StrS family aminotransferase [Armatimonadota bacterium]|nr:DegT/DnrJ/EryC1/StrS family aminotransferase [Armatimonadota bacterium]